MRRHETMVPARNLLRRHYDSYGGWFIDTHVDFGDEKPSVRSDVPMAAEHSRSNGNQEEDEEEEEEEERGDDWLRLGIGRSANTTAAPHVDPTTSSGAQRGRLTELELFSDRATTTSSLSSVPRPPPPPLPAGFIPPMMPLFPPGYRRDVSWGFWNTNPMMLPTTSTPPPPPLQYGFRRFVYPPGSSGTPVLVGSGDVRVVRPPRRPQAGVWFVLQASQNQAREPFLPQIPKNYLRIKDGRMTVRLLMKYLVNKLGLDDESEVEITCRGQPLLPYLTLQHVRDNIWCLRAVVELLPDSPAATADSVMTLQYGRSST